MNAKLPDRHEALVRHGTTLQLEDVPTQSPGAGGVLIELSCVGVCGTDLQILNGTRPDTATILGHEGAGVVVQAGARASLQVGESVVFNPAAQLAEGQILGHNTPGLFQRYITVDSPAIDDGLVLSTQKHLPPLYCPLVEPLGTVIYAHELIARRVPNLRSILILGAGPIGLLSAIYCHDLGMCVLLVHPRQARLDAATALKLGRLATTVTPPADRRFDAALICTTRQGAAEALRHAVQMVRDGGCIDLFTNYPAPAPAPNGVSTGALRSVRAANVCGVPEDGVYLSAEVAGRRIFFTGHRGTSRDHLVHAMQVLSKASPYASLITHVLSLREAQAAIQTLAHSHERVLAGSDCIKAVIDMHRV